MAHQAWEAGNVDRVVELLERHETGPDEEQFRGYQWRHLRYLCERSQNTPSLDHGSRIWSMDLSREGDMVATIGYGPDVKVWSTQQTRRPQLKLRAPANIGSTAFSPDGRILAVDNGSVKLYGLPGGQRLGEPLPHSGGNWNCVAFSSDGATLAAAGFSKLVGLWDVESQTKLHSFKGHEFKIFGVAFSPNGKTLASASYREVILWDVPSGTKRCVAGEDVAAGWCVAFAPDGKTLASGGLDGTVWFWDPETGRPLGAVPERAPGYITSLAYSSDSRLAAGSADGSVILWDLKTNAKLDALRGHQEMVRGLRFSSDNAMLASASLDGTVKLWDVAAPMPAGLLKGHTQQVTSLAFVPDGSTIVSGSFDRTVRFWDVHTGEELATLQPHRLGVQALAISPDGKMAASVSLDNKVALLDAASAEPKQYLSQQMPMSAAFFPDVDRLAVCGAVRPVLKVWDWANHAPVKYDPLDNSLQLRAVTVSPDGQLLACGGWDKLVRLLDARTGDELQALPGHGGDVQCLAFSPDGTTLASGAVDNKVILWDVASRQQRETLSGHTGPVNSLAFSPDGKMLASGSNDRTIRLWYLDVDKESEILPEYAPVTSVAFSPDGTILASGSGQDVRLWRTAAPKRSEELNVLTSLERGVRTIAEAEPQRQRRILDDLKGHLAASASEGLLQRDIILATSTARRLEDCGQHELAGEVFRSFGEAIGSRKDPRNTPTPEPNTAPHPNTE
jgi:WD40 repeat protein